MRTVKFNDYDSYRDFGLLLRPKERPFPEPKLNYVSIEGKSGDIDLSDALTGDVAYENVEFPLEFYVIDSMKTWEKKLRTISSILHGKKLKVIFSEDPNWYYTGRVTIGELSTDRNLGILSLECNFEPYKLAVNETIITKKVKENDVIVLDNQRKWVMPVVIVTNDIIFKYEDVIFSVNSQKEFQSTGFILKEGKNVITIISGLGDITFKYREGAL